MQHQPNFIQNLRNELADGRLWLDRSIVLAYAIAAGLSVVAFTLLAEWSFAQFERVFHWQGGWAVLVWTPAWTAAIVWATQRFTPGAAGSGIPQVMAALEPALECIAALHSPSTGIIDSHGLMLALQGDLENAGGLVVLNSPLARARIAQKAIELIASDGTQLHAQYLINAAGLHAPQLAHAFEGLDPAHIPVARFAKGSYFALAGKAPFKHLIYPAPEAAGLGVHLTLDLGGQAKFGPDVQWVDSAEDLLVDPRCGDAFYAEVRKYWPALPDGALAPGYAGMRPKIHGPHDPAADFCIQGQATHGIPGLVNLFGIESPGLTSALAIGEHVAQMLMQPTANL